MRGPVFGVMLAAAFACDSSKPASRPDLDGSVEVGDGARSFDGPTAPADSQRADGPDATPDLRPPTDDRPAQPDGPPVVAVPPVIAQFQTFETKDRMCLTSTAPSAEKMVQGTLDLALDKNYPYILAPLVTLPNGAPRLLLSFIHVRVVGPAGVTVTWPDGCPSEFDVRFGALDLDPGGTISGGIEVLQACHEDGLRALFAKGLVDARLDIKVMMKLTVNAKAYLGIDVVPSAPVDFPIRICVGCLQTGFPAPYDVYNYPKVPLCSQLTSNPFLGNPCNPAQDFGPVLCCARDATGAGLKCPAQQ